MSDQYDSVRSLSFPALASALGLDLKRFKTRKGGEYYGPCPVHSPKNNSTSFSFAPDGKFNCFSCSAKGRGGIDLTKLVKNVGFKEAVELLGSVPPPTMQKPAFQAPVTSGKVLKEGDNLPLPLAKDTWRKFAVPCPWLEARIPDASIRERYGVFQYHNPARRSAYSGRVMMPVKDTDGRLFGYLGRLVPTAETPGNPQHSTEPKYLFPKNLPKSRFLFGSAEILAGTFGPAPLRVVYLLESPFACMKFAMYGLPAVAAYGWSVSAEQVETLGRLTRGAVYIPDRNKYSEASSCLQTLAQRLWVKMPTLPEGTDDPEQLTKEQILAL